MNKYNIPTEEEFISLRNNWLDGPGKESYLFGYCQIFRNFKETSCEITTETLKYHFTGNDEWLYLSDNLSFIDVYKKYSLFQVIFGEEPESIEHTMIIVNNKIIQSYFMSYTYSIRDLTKEDIFAFSDIGNKDNYKRLTGRYAKKPIDIKLFFLVPKSLYD